MTQYLFDTANINVKPLKRDIKMVSIRGQDQHLSVLSNKTHKKAKLEIFCPICHLKLESDDCWVNMHIDKCLKKQVDVYNEVSSSSFGVVPHKSISGLFLLHEFVTEKEEIELLKLIENDSKTPWMHSSFNGHCMNKTFGVKTQFGLPGEERLVRKNCEAMGEYDIPDYFRNIIDRFETIVNDMNIPSLGGKSFKVNECNINSYSKSAGHYLRPHYDDRALSGPILINLSLLGHCSMTYTKAATGETTAVSLPRRCLQIVSGNSRWNYLHEIKAEDIHDSNRISVTWRQSGGKKDVRPLSGRDRSTYVNDNLEFEKQALDND